MDLKNQEFLTSTVKKTENQTKNDGIDQNTMNDDDEWSDDDDSLFIEAIKASKSTSKSVSKSPERTTTTGYSSLDDSVIILDSPPPQKKMTATTSTKNNKSNDWSFLCAINSFPSRNRIIIQGFIVTLAGKIQLNQAGITVKGESTDPFRLFITINYSL